VFTWGADAKLWELTQIVGNGGWGTWQIADQDVFVYGGYDIQVGRNPSLGKLELFSYGRLQKVWHNLQR